MLFKRIVLLSIMILLVTACSGDAQPVSESAPTEEAQSAAPEAESASSETPTNNEEIKVGLITKTETNPFFVKMKEGAQQAAEAQGAELLTAAGQFDGDNESQVTAIENMVNAGVQGIMITPSNTKAIVPAIQKARDAGVMVIALDTPTEPQEATDALFATDNYQAGVLIGEYAKAAMEGQDVKIATLDLAPVSPLGNCATTGSWKGSALKKATRALCAARIPRATRPKVKRLWRTVCKKTPTSTWFTLSTNRQPLGHTRP